MPKTLPKQGQTSSPSTLNRQRPDATIQEIHQLGCKAGIPSKPNTPAELVKPYLDQVEMVLVMTVEPGFGGQKFMTDMMDKVRSIRSWTEQRRD